MSLFSGSDSRTSSSNTTYDTTVSTVDNRVSEGNARVGGNVTVNPGDVQGPLSISTTDQGAVQAGVDIALESIRTVQNLATANASSSRDIVSQGFDLAQEARQSETSGAINKLVMYGAAVLIVGLIVYGVTRAKS